MRGMRHSLNAPKTSARDHAEVQPRSDQDVYRPRRLELVPQLVGQLPALAPQRAATTVRLGLAQRGAQSLGQKRAQACRPRARIARIRRRPRDDSIRDQLAGQSFGQRDPTA